MKYNFKIDSYIGYPISKQWVAQKLKETEGKPCNVRINSYGGDVQTALDIRQQFIDHGHVTACIFGMTASAATILAMGAKKIVMSRYALMLIHNCSGFAEAWGSFNAEELEEEIAKLRTTQATLETIDRIIASIYALRTGQTEAKIAKAMHRAEWLTAEQCKELGLIDEIIEEGEEELLTDGVRNQFLAAGIPLPAAPSATCFNKSVTCQNAPEADSGNDDETIAEAFVRGLRRVLGLTGEGKKNKEETTIGKKIMDSTENFVEIAALLAPFGGLTAANDDTLSLTQEQLTALEGRLAAAKGMEEEAAQARATEQQLNERIALLEAQIKALKKADGAESGQVDPAAPAGDQLTAAALFERVAHAL